MYTRIRIWHTSCPSCEAYNIPLEWSQREASFEHKKTFQLPKIKCEKAFWKFQKNHFALPPILIWHTFISSCGTSRYQMIAHRLKKLLRCQTPSNSYWKWTQCYLPRQKSRFSRLTTAYCPPGVATRTYVYDHTCDWRMMRKIRYFVWAVNLRVRVYLEVRWHGGSVNI